MRISFHGAAGCVTGSRFLLEDGASRALVDCGMFQGWKVLRERNWRPLPFEASSVEAVFLTHAHIDHSGFLPVLVREGFQGRVYCTAATRDLCGILLPDSGRIHEEDARYANRKGFSKHQPALPLYTEKDAKRALRHFEAVAPGKEIRAGAFSARWSDAGHILGASSILVRGSSTSVVFSGDLGREEDVLMTAPAPPPEADWMVLESTYGDRLHPEVDPLEGVGEPLRRALERGGVVLIPSFAVGRTQAVLYLIHEMFEAGRVPRVPVHVDSPMATEVTALYRSHLDEHRLDADRCRAVCTLPRFARNREESKALDAPGRPRIIVSASGMLTGGRVLHHFAALAGDAKNLILLPGFQAPGTRGGDLAAGERRIKLHGRVVTVRAEVEQLTILSAHADRGELLRWAGRAPRPPRGVYLVHGEAGALDAMRREVRATLGVPAQVADHGETVDLEHMAALARG